MKLYDNPSISEHEKLRKKVPLILEVPEGK